MANSNGNKQIPNGRHPDERRTVEEILGTMTERCLIIQPPQEELVPNSKTIRYIPGRGEVIIRS